MTALYTFFTPNDVSFRFLLNYSEALYDTLTLSIIKKNKNLKRELRFYFHDTNLM